MKGRNRIINTYLPHIQTARGSSVSYPGNISSRYPTQLLSNAPGDIPTKEPSRDLDGLIRIIIYIYPNKEPSTSTVFRYSSRYPSVFIISITSGGPSGSPSDKTTKYPFNVTIMKPPSAPSETPTEDNSYFKK